MNDQWPYSTPGIADELFNRNEVPMTKEEVRVLTLAKARLAPRQTVWDIGSGTGSLSVEAALLVPGGTVYAVERTPRGLEATQSNIAKFAVANVVLISGAAPEALQELPDPHRVIIGGSGGRLAKIFQIVMHRLQPGGRVVVNAVTLETLAVCQQFMSKWGGELIQVNISRVTPVGKVHMWRALNPIYIYTAGKNREEV